MTSKKKRVRGKQSGAGVSGVSKKREKTAKAKNGGAAAKNATVVAMGLAHPPETGEGRVPPGLYRAHVKACAPLKVQLGWWSVAWSLEITGPLGVAERLFKVNEVLCSERAEVLRREFFVLGINLENMGGIEAACAEAVDKHVFVEVLPTYESSYDRVHFQQEATTHHIAVPDEQGLTQAEAEAREVVNVYDGTDEDGDGETQEEDREPIVRTAVLEVH